MIKVLISNCFDIDVSRIIIDQIKTEGFNISTLENCTLNDLVEKIEDIDYLIASGSYKFNEEVLSLAKNLKMISRTGVGLDNFDFDYLKRVAIPLYVNKGVNSESVAEHTIMLMLSAIKRLNLVHENTKNGGWDRHSLGILNNEIKGKIVGVIGAGKTAQEVIKRLYGFDVTVLYTSPRRLPVDFENRFNLEYTCSSELFKKADIITLHCSLNEETHHIVNYESLALMKKNVIIINTSRGKLICESDLFNALKSGRVQYAGLDVFDVEPVEKYNPLLELDNVIVTPHIAGLVYESIIRMYKEAMHNIISFHKGDLDKIIESRVL